MRFFVRRADSLLYDLPASLQDLYDSVLPKGTYDCEHQLDTAPDGYKTNGAGKDGTHVCGDDGKKPTIAYWMSNMDIDCDGGDPSSTECADDPSWLGDTAYQDPSGKNIDAVAVP